MRSTRIALLLVNTFLAAELAIGADPGKLPEPFTAETFRAHVEFLSSDELAGRAPGTEGAEQAAGYVVARLKEFGWRPLQKDGSWYQEFPLKTENLASGNTIGKSILALLPGQGALAEEAVIVTAHYDHLGVKTPTGRPAEESVYNGADDNASGVAAILMIAEDLGRQRESLPEPRRAVIFASFDAEEQGLLGAKHYVRHPLWPLEKTAAVINFDGVGRMRLGKFFASDAETNPMLAAFVRESADLRNLVAETNFGGHGRSDHVPFQEQGIPGMHFFSGAHRDYHQVTDDWPLLNLQGGADIAWVGGEVVREAAFHAGPLEFKPLSPKVQMNFVLNLIRSMGLVPNVNAQEGRYPEILFVMPRSPAAEAGMKSGDQITSLNGMRINRVEDALIIFPQLTYENGLRMTILRGEEEVEINLPASFFAALQGPKSTPLGDGKHEVEFRYKAASKVRGVCVAGSFNRWSPEAEPMEKNDQGVFVAKLELNAGVYEYKFVLDGETWEADPENINRVGQHGNSVVWVGRQGD